MRVRFICFTFVLYKEAIKLQHSTFKNSTMKEIRSKVIQLAKNMKEVLKPIYGSKWWGYAMSAAWKISKMFFGRAVSFVFDKVNKKTGEVTERPAVGIAVASLKTIAGGFVRFLEQVGGRTQWRAFRIERLKFA